MAVCTCDSLHCWTKSSELMSSKSRRFDGKVVLVTGASRGIGAAVARAFGAEGAQLVLIARTSGALEEVDDEIRSGNGRPSLLVPLDLKDAEAIDRLGSALYERFGVLDILIGNAATLGVLSPSHHIDPDTWQETMEINVNANWRLIRSMDPLLRRSDAGRAIFVTSGVTTFFPAYWSAYTTSKSALEALVNTWAREVAKTSLRVNLLDPGVVRTAMRAKAFPGEDPEQLPDPAAIAPAFLEMASPTWTRNGERLLAARVLESLHT